MGERRRILFVDDEPNILGALRDLLRKHRGAWDMVFVPSGEAALEELARAPFDVVVTDMRMPGMDGAALLERVRAEHPGVARIVLSGYADREAVVRAIPVSHQYLAKPCEADALVRAITRTCALKAEVESEDLQRLLGQLQQLPSLPRTYHELTRTMADPLAGAADVAAVVETDPAMSAKILQLANSAYFGAGHRKHTIAAAVAYLGVEVLKALALSAHLFAELERSARPAFPLERLQQASLLGARLARRFLSGRTGAEEAFTAAVVHDVGRMILATHLPERYAAAVRRAEESGECLLHAEQAELGATHPAVGAYLLGVWGLPFAIVEVAAHHHQPSRAPSPSAPALLAAVHVAAALSSEALPHEAGGGGACPLDEPFLESVGLAGELPRWRERAAEELGSGAVG